MDFIKLKSKPVDPNKAKYWALGLVVAAAIFATLTIKSNYDYFLLYFAGWALWLRLVPFFGLETYVVFSPLTKGWGSRRHAYLALVSELILGPGMILHTSLVGNVTQTRIATEKAKAEAQADFDRLKAAQDSATARNRELQEGYKQAMATYNIAAAR